MKRTRAPLQGWHEIALFAILLGVAVTMTFVSPKSTQWNAQVILSKHMWETAVLSIGMTMIIITAGIDLSVGSAMALCAVAYGICMESTGNVPLSMIVCLLVGLGAGFMNGALIAKLRIHPLIVTLATYAAYRGIAEGISQGHSYEQVGVPISNLVYGRWLGVPIPAYLFMTLACFATLCLSRTPTGRFIYAIGHNEEAARFSAVRVDRIKLGLYATSGLIAAIASLLNVARFSSAKADVGRDIEMDVITAVVIGGTSIFGGRGNLLGTTLGVLLIHETKILVSHWRIDELKSIVVGGLLIGSILVQRRLRSDSQP